MSATVRLLGGAIAVLAFSIVAYGCGKEGQSGVRTSTDGAEQRSTAPRTLWGHPDLQGVWTANHEITVPIEKPDDPVNFTETEEPLPGFYGESAQEEAFEVADARGGPTGAGPGWWYEVTPSAGRTHQLIDPPDGKLPPLTPWAQEIVEALEAREQERRAAPTSYRDLGLMTRCLTQGMPGSMVPGGFMYNHGYEIVQTSESVAIRYEMVHDVRIISLDGRPPLGSSIRTWFGSSRGRWEEDTLVVETQNLNDETPVLGFRRGGAGPGINSEMRVIERFTLADADTLTFEATIDNPKVFTAPWTISIPLKRDNEYQIFEYACHEGNQAVENILKGALAEAEASR